MAHGHVPRALTRLGRRAPVLRVGRWLALVLPVVLALASCTSAPGRSGAPTPSTTTTLPTPVTVPGTGGTGTASFLGVVERVPVVPVPEGATAAPVAVPGSPLWAERVLVAYRDLGSGPPVVLLPGEDATLSWWPPLLLEALSAHDRILVVDLPGTGLSGAPLAGGVSLASLADDMAGFVDALGLRRPVVVGWGLGGEVALALAERHAGLLGGLVLVDTSAGGPAATPTPSAVTAVLDGPDTTPLAFATVLFGPSVAASAPVGATASASAAAASSSAAASSAASATAFLNGLAETGPDVMTRASQAMEAAIQSAFWRGPGLVAGLAGLELPCLVVEGAADEVFPLRDARLLASALPRSRLVVLPDAGYGAPLEDPGRFAALVERFTATLSSRS